MMQVFVWKGTNADGTRHEGEMVAANSSAVLESLRKQKYRNIEVTQRARGGWFRSNRVTEQDVVLFIRQLSVMVNAGLPLTTCFTLVGKGSSKPAIHEASHRIRTAIELGHSLSNAMAKEPLLFDAFSIQLMRVSEKSGVLQAVLERLANHKEKNLVLKGKVKSALTYPIAVLGVAFVIFYLLMVKVVPVFENFYRSMATELPLPTRMVVAVSDFTQTWWWAVLLGGVFTFKLFGYCYRKSDYLHYQTDRVLLLLPLFGELLRKAAVARFARSFSTMLAAGTPIIDCLENVAETAGNRVVKKALETTRTSIINGGTLTDPLEKSALFPPLVTQMMFIGESTGNLDFMLNKLANYYDEEVDRAVDGLRALMEPLIMIFLGGMIGGIVLGMYLPLLSVAGFAG
ncbi:MAG: type II secretion system F family protein [Magnetococcales bacterium]|nr:type II secretion system F family protein [Magnetococcales bacterium]